MITSSMCTTAVSGIICDELFIYLLWEIYRMFNIGSTKFTHKFSEHAMMIQFEGGLTMFSKRQLVSVAFLWEDLHRSKG